MARMSQPLRLDDGVAVILRGGKNSVRQSISGVIMLVAMAKPVNPRPPPRPCAPLQNTARIGFASLFSRTQTVTPGALLSENNRRGPRLAPGVQPTIDDHFRR